jgi:hypothetical protein
MPSPPTPPSAVALSLPPAAITAVRQGVVMDTILFVMDATLFVKDTTPHVAVSSYNFEIYEVEQITLDCQPTIYTDRKNRHDRDEEGK